MPSSTLDPEYIPEPDRQLGIGHGTDSLGPSDLSDTGSDVQGGYHAVEELDLGLDRGTNEDSDSRTLPAGDDTSDSGKTGEDTTTGRSGDVEMNSDIGIDRIDSLSVDDDVDAENDPDAADYVDPALQANAKADADIAALADDDADTVQAADADDAPEGEVALFDKVTRTEEGRPASRRH